MIGSHIDLRIDRGLRLRAISENIELFEYLVSLDPEDLMDREELLHARQEWEDIFRMSLEIVTHRIEKHSLDI